MATQETLNQVQQLYVAYYGRPADAAGLAFWAGELEANGGDVSAIIDGFGNSAEFEARFGEMSNEELVNNLYQQLFGRDADAEGLDFYTNDLDSGNVTLAEIAATIAGGAQDNEDGDNDLTTLSNKVAAANLYTAATEGQHDGTDADNYAAAWLAGIDADTDVDAIDMDEVVANLPEPTEPTEPEEPSIPGETFTLTEGRDVLTGTENDDTFNAYIFDNQNTLQNGDVINGGAGNDTLYAEIGNSQSFAIQPRLESVENVVISARAVASDSNDNNLFNDVQIDAGQARGVTNWESNDSRADLIIEDVRINPTQVTKDVTITFRDSDSGNVDYAVYFDQQSLISEAPQTDNRLVLSMSNQLDGEGFDPEAPLKDIPYTHFSFELNGEVQTVALDLEDALTYDDLEAALEEAFAAYPEVTVTRSENAQNFFSYNGTPRTADLFTLTVTDGTIQPAQPGWNAEGGLPSDNSFSARVREGDADTTDPLVTSTIVLDNVGSGSTGGNLVIGGMSTGVTSTSQGVQQFDVTVEQSSKLQFLGSTADSLEVVNLVNDGVHNDVVDGKVVERAGNLTLQGDVQQAGFGFDSAVAKPVLTSDLDRQDLAGAGLEQYSGYGLVNVREVNAENFVGDIALTAVLTEAVVEKYLDLQDQAPDAAAADNVMFQYNLGSGNDSLALAIDAANLAEAGTTTREDFELIINAGAGDDVIEVAIYNVPETEETDGTDGTDATPGAVNNLADGNDENWYANSQENANLAIDAGDGDDTVLLYGSGDWNVNLGAGDDAIYVSVDTASDNAVWVFNADIDEPADLDNLLSAGNASFGAPTQTGSLFKSDMTVSFLGFETTVELGLNTNTPREVNQAIKQAIQEDGVLSKLLEVADGPASTLIVRSLIDGDLEDETIGVTFEAPTADDFTAADVAAYNAAYSGAAITDVAGLVAEITGHVPADYDYVAVFGQQDGVDVTGEDSGHIASTTINAGTGDDVIVLGTGGGNDTIVLEDNFGTNTIVYFEAGEDAGANVDVLDFTSYGVAGVTAVGNNYDVVDDQVNVVEFGGFGPSVTFENLTAANVATRIGNEVDTGRIDSIILVHNTANPGEYKAFDVNSANNSTDFTVDLIGVLDFGENLTESFTADNFA